MFTSHFPIGVGMKVILLQDIRGLGKKNDVKDVSDGFARNRLLPGNLVEPATDSALARLRAFKARSIAEDAALVKRLHEIAATLKHRTIELTVRTDKTGKVFGSVNTDTILKALRDANILNTERVDIALQQPIKTIGDHKVAVDLKHGVIAELTVRVRPQP